MVRILLEMQCIFMRRDVIEFDSSSEELVDKRRR